jgi:hypothetical protein
VVPQTAIHYPRPDQKGSSPMINRVSFVLGFFALGFFVYGNGTMIMWKEE